jgi:hypothetical protein
VWAQRAAAQKPSPAVTTKAAKKEQSTPAAAAAAATPATQEKHVPVNNFNYGEVKQMMGQKEARSVYKVDTSASASDRKFPMVGSLHKITDTRHSSMHGKREELLGSSGRAGCGRSAEGRRETVDTDRSTRHAIQDEPDS